MVLSYEDLVLNHSFAYTVFCLHGCSSKVSKNSVSRGPTVSKYLKSRPIKRYEWNRNYTVVTSKHDLTILRNKEHGNELTGYFQKYLTSSYYEIKLYLKY